MKKLLFSLTALVCTTTLFAQKKVADVAKFESESIDLGKVKQDNPSVATFVVTNISNEPLIIEQANPTCGCTISDYTKAPIAPGKTGTIKATYNAKAVGPIDKHLTVKFAGVDEVKSIGIKGEVLTTEAYAKLNPGAIEALEVKSAPAETKTPAKVQTKRPATKKTTTTTTKTSTLTHSPKS